jgi:ELWxxDGT repeat protein
MCQLWRSDGTEAGTFMVKDIMPGPDWSHPGSLTDVGGTLYFVATDGSHGYELWRSDGDVCMKAVSPKLTW